MKRNLNVVHKNHEGRPIVRPVYKFDESDMPIMTKTGTQEIAGYEPVTMRLLAINAVGGRWRGDESMTIAQAKARTVLYDKLVADGDVELDDEEPKMILDCMLRQGLDPVSVGRMAALLDPK